ncbi:hypothetical protein BH18ACI1_BH18ACI1_10120 [soil metagenome]
MKVKEMTTKFLVIIEKGNNNHSAYSPDVLSYAATWKTVEKTLASIKEASVVKII